MPTWICALRMKGLPIRTRPLCTMPCRFRKISKIVQVGIRDFCEQEVEVALKDRVLVHTDMDLKQETFEGKTWQEQCDKIIASLPEKVCISFDIDGMYPIVLSKYGEHRCLEDFLLNKLPIC